jgi:hypothetical protein
MEQDSAYLIAASNNYTGASTNWGTLGIQHKIKVNSGGTPRVTIDTANGGESFTVVNNGNVGIGTTDPTSKLYIQDDNADTKITIRGGGSTVNDSNVTIQLLETASSFYGGAIQYSGISAIQGLRLGHYVNSSTPRIDMAIDRGTGNVGIGTTDPTSKLHVNGSLKHGTNNYLATSGSGGGYAELGNGAILLWGLATMYISTAGSAGWTWYYPNNFTLTEGYGFTAEMSDPVRGLSSPGGFTLLGMGGIHTNRISGFIKTQTVGAPGALYIWIMGVGKKT